MWKLILFLFVWHLLAIWIITGSFEGSEESIYRIWPRMILCGIIGPGVALLAGFVDAFLIFGKSEGALVGITSILIMVILYKAAYYVRRWYRKTFKGLYD